MLKMILIKYCDPVVRIFMEFTQIACATLKYIDKRFYQELRLSLTKYIALQALSVKGDTAKHTDLAVWTNTKKHNITALVECMKEEDLVTTERSQTDKRVNNIVLTDRGREVYKQANR
jgi:DNA-binding MarR family transcriptional regulator